MKAISRNIELPAINERFFTILKLFFLSFLININIFSQSVFINEFMASNSSVLADKDGEYSDWIEIYNSTSDDVNLSGWALTDDKNDSLKWVFPDAIVNANSYLIVFASGKNIVDQQVELHTNFKLAAKGEYLALFDPDGSSVTEFDPYPEQYADISYGYFDDYYLSMSAPTPGEENQFDGEIVLPAPEFSSKRGFYETPFNLEINVDFSNLPAGQGDAQIFYTIDGTEPNDNNGTEYTSPLLINKTTVLRAVTIKGNLSSDITTSSFLFLNDIINQPNNPAGYPSEWGEYIESQGTAIADYEMDPEVTEDPQYSGLIKNALLSIPTISIVTDKNNLFSHSNDPDSGGLYIYTGAPANSGGYAIGKGWERPASIEYFNSDSSNEFQIDCGIRIHGGHSRRPEKTPKHSFRIVFRSEYGKSKLDYPFFGSENPSSFNSIVLRATYGNTWLHRNASERNHAQLIHDLWAKDTQLDMGHPSGHGFFAHLYINGIYWGIYNPTERIDNDFGETYIGGNEEDYDVIKDYAEVSNGNIEAWNAMMDIADNGLEDNVNYQRIQGKNPDGSYNPDYEAYLDIVNFIDYMIINFYGANWDWDQHNWVAVRNRNNPGKGFNFFCWDAEHILESVSSNVLNLNNSNRPSGLFQQLRKNEDFRRLFADRVQLHCFNSGALTPEASLQRWMKRAEEIDLAIIAESARWGDYRRDVHQQYAPFDLYTKEHWLTELSFLVEDYFPNRTNTFINQLREAGLFPEIDAPQFLINGEQKSANYINSGDELSISSGLGRTVYYTIDNSDPLMNGEVSPNAIKYSEPLELTQSIHIKARTYYRDMWSALNEKIFVLSSDLNNLKITEIHYHPLPEDTIGDGNFEFIELKNVGSSPIDLSGVKFIEGISFSFPADSILNPDKFIVLASNQYYFNMRYNFIPFGEYQGSLDNSGERIVLTNILQDTIVSIRYNDREPWPESADGSGYSLVTKEFNANGDQNDPANWRSSINIHGSPGKDDEETTFVEEHKKSIPDNFILYQNYPNPFNPATRISYALPKGNFVTLKIYNVLGQEVKTLVNEYQEADWYSIYFNANNLASGVYFYSLHAGNNFNEVKKMLYIR
jgi:hypothetical protein